MRAFVARILAAAFAGTLAFGVAALPLGASAQGVPSYGRPASADETIHGRITAMQGPYAIVVLDDRGFLDTVSLRQGTIINPRGLRLAVGMDVTIVGYNAGTSFAAVEIDVPSGSEGPAPADYAGYGGYDYDDYGLAAAYGIGAGFFVPPEQVVPVGSPAAPKTGAPRYIEHPKPDHPVREPLDATPSTAPNPDASSAPSAPASPALPSYASPLVGVTPSLGFGGGGTTYRGATAPQARGMSPQARAEAPRSEPARSAPASSSSSSRSH
jgi:hypothetical protein